MKLLLLPSFFFFLVLQFAAHLKFTFVFSSPATKEGGALIEHWYDKMIGTKKKSTNLSEFLSISNLQTVPAHKRDTEYIQTHL